MNWFFLSPHYDDVVFSCGGLVWEQAQAGGRVVVVTICGGAPDQEELSDFAQEIHQSWEAGENPVAVRRKEDEQACRMLEAEPLPLSFPDAVYRKSSRDGSFLYGDEESLFGGLDPREEGLIYSLAEQLEGLLSTPAVVVAPLGIGNHVDHELTRKAAARLDREILYYADFPYLREEEGRQILEHLQRSGEWKAKSYTLSADGIKRWQQAGLAYQSQIGTFWKNEKNYQEEIKQLVEPDDQLALWSPLSEGEDDRGSGN